MKKCSTIQYRKRMENGSGSSLHAVKTNNEIPSILIRELECVQGAVSWVIYFCLFYFSFTKFTLKCLSLLLHKLLSDYKVNKIKWILIETISLHFIFARRDLIRRLKTLLKCVVAPQISIRTFVKSFSIFSHRYNTIK